MILDYKLTIGWLNYNHPTCDFKPVSLTAMLQATWDTVRKIIPPWLNLYFIKPNGDIIFCIFVPDSFFQLVKLSDYEPELQCHSLNFVKSGYEGLLYKACKNGKHFPVGMYVWRIIGAKTK